MTKFAIALSFVALVACTSHDSKPEPSEKQAQISSDCVSWKDIKGQAPSTTFLRGADGSISYVDFPNRTYTVFALGGGEPYIFDYSEAGWIHMTSGDSFESLRADVSPREDEMGSLMSKVVTAALAVAKTNRWVVYPEKGRYYASFLGKRCTLEPKAVGAFCDADGTDCYLIPAKHVSKSEGNALACIREAGVLAENHQGELAKACEHFTNPEGRNRISDISVKSQSCPGYSLPEVRRVSAATCKDVPSFFKKLSSAK